MPPLSRAPAQDHTHGIWWKKSMSLCLPAKEGFLPENVVVGRVLGKPQEFASPPHCALPAAVRTPHSRMVTLNAQDSTDVVDANCSLSAQRPGFETELRRHWFHPDKLLVLTALFLLPVSPSFSPLRTTAALLSRGTWRRISRRSLGTCS